MENTNSKRKFRFTIGNKIFGGFLILIVLFIVNATVIFFTGNSIDNVVKSSSDNIRPSKDAINEFILTVTKSKMLITNWVYLQTNSEDKLALKQIKDFDYPALKEKINKLKPFWQDSQRVMMDSVFSKFDFMMKQSEENVMNKLVSFESYEDSLTKLLAEDAIDSQVIPQSAEMIKLLDKIADLQSKITAESDDRLIKSSEQLRSITLTLGVAMVAISFIVAFFLVRAITGPVNFMKEVIVRLGRGELDNDKKRAFSNDEIGEMAVAVDNLVSGLKGTTGFAENIGNGKYDSEFQPLSEHDVLGNALLNMRGNLSRVAEEDKKRNWATEGMAKFGEILRTNNNDVQKLSDEIIANLVKYLKANQGALYIIDDTDSEEATMSMTACYAWDKKKYLNQKIYRGEGLAGQCWQEMDAIYLTDVPQNYIRITSGLGDANPSCILIVPLKVNDQIFGVVELASFNILNEHEVEFVKKISESIASTISTVKINERTTKLLEESQQMTEEMRAQEEEMRQNMEELQATQEGMTRVVKEAQDKEGYLNNLINASTDSIFAIDRDYKLVISNEAFNRTLAAQGISANKGFSMLNVGGVEDKEAKGSYDKALRGESFETTTDYGSKVYRVTYNPLKDASGKVIGVAVFWRDMIGSK